MSPAAEQQGSLIDPGHRPAVVWACRTRCLAAPAFSPLWSSPNPPPHTHTTTTQKKLAPLCSARSRRLSQSKSLKRRITPGGGAPPAALPKGRYVTLYDTNVCSASVGGDERERHMHRSMPSLRGQAAATRRPPVHGECGSPMPSCSRHGRSHTHAGHSPGMQTSARRIAAQQTHRLTLTPSSCLTGSVTLMVMSGSTLCCHGQGVPGRRACLVNGRLLHHRHGTCTRDSSSAPALAHLLAGINVPGAGSLVGRLQVRAGGWPEAEGEERSSSRAMHAHARTHCAHAGCAHDDRLVGGWVVHAGRGGPLPGQRVRAVLGSTPVRVSRHGHQCYGPPE